MGLNCRIIRVNNKVEVVEAPNGAYSTLYQDALNLTKNEEEALKIWAVAYSDKFINYNEVVFIKNLFKYNLFIFKYNCNYISILTHICSLVN